MSYLHKKLSKTRKSCLENPRNISRKIGKFQLSSQTNQPYNINDHTQSNGTQNEAPKLCEGRNEGSETKIKRFKQLKHHLERKWQRESLWNVVQISFEFICFYIGHHQLVCDSDWGRAGQGLLPRREPDAAQRDRPRGGTVPGERGVHRQGGRRGCHPWWYALLRRILEEEGEDFKLT